MFINFLLLQKLNPLLSVEDLNLSDVIEQMFSNIDKYMIGANELNVDLKMPIDGGFFKFSLDFGKSDCQEFHEQVTKPLLRVAAELNHRENILIDLVKRKDEEIAEHKAGGSELLRSKTFHKINLNNVYLFVYFFCREY